MRDYFAEEMAKNDGARGLLLQLEVAQEAGDKEQVDRIWSMIKEFNEKEL